MFKSIDSKSLSRFNSDKSCSLYEAYESQVIENIRSDNARLPHKTFAPSSFRCDRRSWFRLRGTVPDTIKSPDITHRFIADCGTACHEIVQGAIAKSFADRWIDPADYISSATLPYEMSCESTESKFEKTITVNYPPVRFACDGILKFDDEYTLLEIKSCESGTWMSLTEPRDEHIDQVKLYATLLNIKTVLFLYIDRQYGQVKCYEVRITDSDIEYVKQKMERVLYFVEKNLAPEGLPVGDKWCNENYCPYYTKCKAYGHYRYE